MATTGPRRQRRHDPDRRERILRAAIAVVARDGIEGFTHRAVAVEADVPLGSMTYHFTDKTELLTSAIDLAQAADHRMHAELLARFSADTDLAAALAGMVEQLTVHGREQLVFGYELFLAARRQSSLAPSARRWVDDTEGLLAGYSDARTARILIAMLEGMLVRCVVLHEAFPAAVTEPDFRHVLAAAGCDGP